MVALAEVEGSNALKIKQAQQRLEREIAPLAKEVERALHETGREELFYQAPTVDGGGSGANGGGGDMESLIGNSEALLRESQAWVTFFNIPMFCYPLPVSSAEYTHFHCFPASITFYVI